MIPLVSHPPSAMAASATKKRKATDTVVEALSVAQNELDEREAKLQEREEALRKAIEGVEETHDLAYAMSRLKDILFVVRFVR